MYAFIYRTALHGLVRSIWMDRSREDTGRELRMDSGVIT